MTAETATSRSLRTSSWLATAVAARPQDATDPDAVRSYLVATVQHALEPAHLSLWLTGGPS
jgi:hypothetical protein